MDDMSTSSADARVRAMYALYGAGATLDEVGARFGVTRARVSQLFSAAGLPTRRRGWRRANREGRSVANVRATRERHRARGQERAARAREERARKMAAMYSSGATLEDVGRAFGVTRERARQILAAAGVPARGVRGTRALQRDLELRRSEEIVEAYRRSGRVDAVAKELGVSRSVVSEVVRRERPARPPRTAKQRFRYSREQLIGFLRKAARIYGGPLTMSAYDEVARAQRAVEVRWPDSATFALRFGSWLSALAAAGLPRARLGPRRNRYTAEACVTAVARAADELGRTPSMREYDAWAKSREGVPAAHAVFHACGSWTAAKRSATRLQRGPNEPRTHPSE